ncbi:hypothetical protein EVAR_3960_1 [Eumeta japonica]|uniref:Uncharacterized protein n=1 Tax=Eumeta variegata TaxID=151549 RepID=A0A4C1SU88_EUMVA|nr:hypothetical protein EVAR_3960_1 [Eumeta japonica]
MSHRVSSGEWVSSQIITRLMSRDAALAVGVNDPNIWRVTKRISNAFQSRARVTGLNCGPFWEPFAGLPASNVKISVVTNALSQVETARCVPRGARQAFDLGCGRVNDDDGPGLRRAGVKSLLDLK